MTFAINAVYFAVAVLFILGLKAMSSPVTARRGIAWAGIGMVLATIATFVIPDAKGSGPLLFHSDKLINLVLIVVAIIIGGGVAAYLGKVVKMTDMPQMVAIYNGMGGGAAALIAAVEFSGGNVVGVIPTTLAVAGSFIGSIAFSGSVIAFLKLQGIMKKAIALPQQNLINIALALVTLGLGIWIVVAGANPYALVLFFILSLLLGVFITSPIGGADMPVVVSMLNSYSGWAAAALGFTLENIALIITGALVGSSGAILSYIMCKGMNRSFISVILGGFGGEVAGAAGHVETRPVKQGSADDAAFIMKNASKVIIVPGYGMAVSQAQHALREMGDKLKEEGVEVKYAIHPVAGRMPGHMNVLLAEANVPYDEVFELEDINAEFPTADVAFVIGANDVTNPAAKTDPTSAIYGMPILDVEKARTVLFVKRGMSSGYAGVENELFFRDNTMMLFGDAKKMVEGILKGL